MNKTSLLQRYAMQQDYYYGIAAYYFAHHYSDKQYISYGHQLILIIFYWDMMDMNLIYVSI